MPGPEDNKVKDINQIEGVEEKQNKPAEQQVKEFAFMEALRTNKKRPRAKDVKLTSEEEKVALYEYYAGLFEKIEEGNNRIKELQMELKTKEKEKESIKEKLRKEVSEKSVGKSEDEIAKIRKSAEEEFNKVLEENKKAKKEYPIEIERIGKELSDYSETLYFISDIFDANGTSVNKYAAIYGESAEKQKESKQDDPVVDQHIEEQPEPVKEEKVEEKPIEQAEQEEKKEAPKTIEVQPEPVKEEKVEETVIDERPKTEEIALTTTEEKKAFQAYYANLFEEINIKNNKIKELEKDVIEKQGNIKNDKNNNERKKAKEELKKAKEEFDKASEPIQKEIDEIRKTANHLDEVLKKQGTSYNKIIDELDKLEKKEAEEKARLEEERLKKEAEEKKKTEEKEQEEKKLREKEEQTQEAKPQEETKKTIDTKDFLNRINGIMDDEKEEITIEEKVAININKSIRDLESAKTLVNSDEYKELINSVKELKELTTTEHFVIYRKLEEIGEKIDKYIDHKAKDGVKANTYKKLAAVQELNEWVSNTINSANGIGANTRYKSYAAMYEDYTKDNKSADLLHVLGDGELHNVKDEMKKNGIKLYDEKSQMEENVDIKNIGINTIKAADDCMCAIIHRASKDMRPDLIKVRNKFNQGVVHKEIEAKSKENEKSFGMSM